MTEPVFSAREIAEFLLDSGLIDKGTADRLEKRITAYGHGRASEGRKEGIATAARKAAAAAASVKGVNQRTAAEKVWRAVETLLPNHGREAEKEAYARGFKDGVELQQKRQQHRPGCK